MAKLYGCAKCTFTSRNKKDFQSPIGDNYHYCKDCIIEVRKDNQQKKDKDDGSNVSLSGDTNH